MNIPLIGTLGTYHEHLIAAPPSAGPAIQESRLTVTEAQSVERIQHLLTNQGGHQKRLELGDVCLVAEWEGQPAGAVWLNYGTIQDERVGDTRFNGSTVYANQLLVDPRYRGIGIGRALVLAMRAQPLRKGCECVTGAIAADNQVSLKLHYSNGFHRIGSVLGFRIGNEYVRIRGGLTQQLCARDFDS